MRLIDADALIAKQANIAKTFARSDAQKSIIGRVMYNPEKSPTIDAIPMNWMDAQIRWYASALKSTELTALVLVKQMWEKAQEAR